MSDEGWEARMAARTLRAEVRAQEERAAALARSEAEAEAARVRRFEQGPPQESAGCCHEWIWQLPYGPGEWDWWRTVTCGYFDGRCDHAHHESDETSIPIARLA